MAYSKEEDIRELQQRCHAYADTEKPAFTDVQLGILDRDFNVFLKDAGIPVGADRKVPESGGVPRIFIMGVDANGVEKPMSLDEAGIQLTPKNKKFWEQVGMGNVFVYPAGSEHPIQIQADSEKNFGEMLGYSRPVLPQQMPERQIKQPGIFARIMHTISFGRLYKEVAAYNNQQKQNLKQELKNKLASMDSARASSRAGELAQAREAQRLEAEAEHQKKLNDKVQNAKKQVNAYNDGYKILHSVYKPVPEKHEYLRKDIAKGKEGLYTDEHFATLKTFSKDELDLSKITLAAKGKIGPSVSEKDFCAVAMFAGMHYSIAENARVTDPNAPAVDIHAVSTMQKNLGITQEQARQLQVEDYNGMYTMDCFIVPKSRDNSGEYFEKGVNGARQMTANAFNAYKNGNKEPLAKLLAFGIDRTCNAMVSFNGVPGNSYKGVMQMGNHLTTIMDKDPELKQLAFKNGMTDKQLKAVENLSEYFKINDARNKAQLKLAEAAANHTELPQEEKEACMKTIIKAKIVDQMWGSEAKLENEQTREVQDKMINPENMVMVSYEQNALWKEHPEQRPAPPEGKFWSDTGMNKFTYAQRLYRPIPSTISSIKGHASLDEVVDRMISEDKLGEKSCEELVSLYNDASRQAKNLPARSVQIAEDIKNEKELGLDQNLNINDVIKEKEIGPLDDPKLDEPLNINAEIEKKQGGGIQI